MGTFTCVPRDPTWESCIKSWGLSPASPGTLTWENCFQEPSFSSPGSESWCEIYDTMAGHPPPWLKLLAHLPRSGWCTPCHTIEHTLLMRLWDYGVEFNMVCISSVVTTIFLIINSMLTSCDRRIYEPVYTASCIFIHSAIHCMHTCCYVMCYTVCYCILYINPIHPYILSSCSCDWYFPNTIDISYMLLLARAGDTPLLSSRLTTRLCFLLIGKGIAPHHYRDRLGFPPLLSPVL